VRLGIYATQLRESHERHAELQESLLAAQATLTALRNSSTTQQALCESARHDHATELAVAERARTRAQLRLEEVTELNSWLNQTAAAREAALRVESERRAQAEGSAMSLKEQINLMQGQLLTAQQQQGTLHAAGRRKSGKH